MTIEGDYGRPARACCTHSGVCSCWRPGCPVCDCGALQRKVVQDGCADAVVAEAWALHTAALDSVIEMLEDADDE